MTNENALSTESAQFQLLLNFQPLLNMYGIKNAKPSDIPDGFYDVVYDLAQDMKINQNENENNDNVVESA